MSHSASAGLHRLPARLWFRYLVACVAGWIGGGLAFHLRIAEALNHLWRRLLSSCFTLGYPDISIYGCILPLKTHLLR